MLKYEHVNVAVSRTNILNDINITFPKGQITTIIGPNGCGKTTLLQCLNGCSKVTAGTITVDNENILSLPLKEKSQKNSISSANKNRYPCTSCKNISRTRQISLSWLYKT